VLGKYYPVSKLPTSMLKYSAKGSITCHISFQLVFQKSLQKICDQTVPSMKDAKMNIKKCLQKYNNL